MMAVTRREEGTTVIDGLQARETLKRGDKEIYPNHRFAVQAVANVVANQNDLEVFEFVAPSALTLAEVQVYCTNVAANTSVNVKNDGVSMLSATIVPVTNTVVTGVIATANVVAADTITVHVTTDGTGSVDNLHVTLIFESLHLA